MARFATLLTALAALGATAASADCLPRLVAPVHYPTKDGVGVIVPSFLDVRDDKGVLQVVHGVDVSHHNKIDYAAVKACGAAFAVIKLDDPASFQSHARGFSGVDTPVMPYSFLYMPATEKRHPEAFLNPGAMADLSAQAEAKGANDAKQFLQNYDAYAFQPVNLAGLSGNVIALDVEETIPSAVLSSDKKKRAAEIQGFGTAYGAMVANWINTVVAAKPDAIIVLYTNPSVYTAYLINARRKDFEVFRGLPVWLAEYKNSGGDGNWVLPEDPTKMKGDQQLCTSAPGGNKCIMHQYTAGGTLGVIADNQHAKTVDLDRVFNVRVVGSGLGKQYVRDAPAYVP